MKNECQLSEEDCSNYLEHDLPDDQKSQFEEHLKSCPECQQKVLQLQVIKNNLRKMPHIQVTKDFETILKARIQLSKNIGRGQWGAYLDRFKAPAYAVSMTAIIAAIFFLHFYSTNQHAQQAIPATVSLQAVSNEAEIQPGDIVYTVDILTFPKESRSIRVPAKKKSSVMRSMFIARRTANSDSTANKFGPGSNRNEESYPVSF